MRCACYVVVWAYYGIQDASVNGHSCSAVPLVLCIMNRFVYSHGSDKTSGLTYSAC